MIPPTASTSGDFILPGEHAMIASVCDYHGKYYELDEEPTSSQIYDIRGYCHFDLPYAHFNVMHDNVQGVFVVELLSGPNIVLHLSFRFYDCHTVVLNSSGPNGWENEERVDNPLRNDEPFHLHIHVHPSHFTINLNERIISTFQHRFPYESIQAIGAHGAAIVDKVIFDGFHFAQNWDVNYDNYDYGHQGYIGYGSSAYEPPQFHPNHPYRRHFDD